MSIQPCRLNRAHIDETVPERSTEIATQVADEMSLRQTDELPEERLQQIRQRILDGMYDSPFVLDAVAIALRSSGDLR